MRKSLIFLALASFPVAQSTGKDEPRPFNAGDYVAPFMLVCLQHYGDAPHQISSAKGMHDQVKTDFWKLQSENKTGITTRLSFGGGTVIVDDGGNNRCSFSAYVDHPITVDQFGATVSQTFGGVSPTKRMGPPEDIVWVLKLQTTQKPLVVAATTSSAGDRNVVTLSVQDF